MLTRRRRPSQSSASRPRRLSRRGDDVVIAGPPALREMVEEAGYPFRPGREPPESEVAAIREKLAVVSGAEASILANRDLFGRLATRAMLPATVRLFESWLLLREPCEYASAVAAARSGTPVVQVAISFAEVEAGSLWPHPRSRNTRSAWSTP